ncbi:MAG TPA: cytochrome P450 [Streptosporangiaceae bacterium]|nr:cytochrome P450 [Streptosporangiaceae bacterium]
MVRGTDPAALGIDLVDLRFWKLPPADRMAAFGRLRALDKPMFFREQRVPLARSGAGFYALVRHADVVEASRNPAVLSSEPAVTSPEPPPWVPLVFGTPLVNMDDPRHARLRRIVSRAFAPRIMARLDAHIQHSAENLVSDLSSAGPADFVRQVAEPMPVQMISAMMGIPGRYQRTIAGRVAAMTHYSGVRGDMRRLSTLRLAAGNVRAIGELRRIVGRLAQERRREPADDLISTLVNANVEGERLTFRELGSFFDLLLVAGTETTRNAIAHGLKLFTDFPEQRELLMSDFDGHIAAAIEEIVRYASPIIQFRRTVTRAYEMRGHAFAKGDKVAMFYPSANHDESVFDRPHVFDITRQPNPHLGFGGPGPHLCLGAYLARKQLTAIFRELFTRYPGIRSVGEPGMLLSNFDNGITDMRFELGPPGAQAH